MNTLHMGRYVVFRARPLRHGHIDQFLDYVRMYVRPYYVLDAFHVHDPTLFMNRIASKSFIALDLSRFFVLAPWGIHRLK